MNTQESNEALRIKVFDNLDFIAVGSIDTYKWAQKSCFKSYIVERKRMVDDLWFADSVEELLTKVFHAYNFVHDQTRGTGVKHRLVLET